MAEPGLLQLYTSFEFSKVLRPCLSFLYQGLTKEGEKTSYALTDKLGEGDPRR